jgi:RNA polymerase sigma-70 factor (ECF subfamily)
MALVEACISGDSRAWHRMIDAYGPRVYGAIRYFMRSYRESLPEEDVLNVYQEVFLDLCRDDFRKLKTFRAGGRLATWLFTVARRQCLDYVRALTRKKRTPLTYAEPDILNLGRPLGEQHDPIAATENREAVLKAMDRMNYRSKLLLVLFYFEGLSYEEISNVMGISETSVSGMIKKARDTIREMLT